MNRIKTVLALFGVFAVATAMQLAFSQTLSGPATNVDIPSQVNALIGTMPESSSWTNTTLKIDVAYSAIGIGQTGTAEAVLRGTYNLGASNSIFGIGAEADFGAADAVDATYFIAELHRDLSPWAEVFAAGGGGWSFADKSAKGFIGVGTRVIPFGSIPQAAIFTELDFVITPANESASAPKTRILAGLDYHF